MLWMEEEIVLITVRLWYTDWSKYFPNHFY